VPPQNYGQRSYDALKSDCGLEESWYTRLAWIRGGTSSHNLSTDGWSTKIYSHRPLCLTYEYYPDDDILDIFLINPQHINGVIDTTNHIDDDWNISVAHDKQGRLISFEIDDATRVLCEV
jgi:uncharacterized protein YuzE